jgi:flagellar motility protein MotE (MotC chaperone)
MPELVYVSRGVRLPLLDADQGPVARIADAVIAPPHQHRPPVVLGLLAAMGRRRIFVNAGRIADIDPTGVRLRSGTVDLRHFRRRTGELLAMEDVIGSRVTDDTVVDVAFRPTEGRTSTWDVEAVALGAGGRLLRRRATRIVGWREVRTLFGAADEMAGAVAEFRQMHPSDAAAAIRALPPERRRRLAEAMDDERLADVLEELPEEEQLRMIEGLDLARIAHLLEEMAPDDAADLLGEMPDQRQQEVLQAMQPEEAEDLRLLLSYGEDTAGGLMNPEPVILGAETTVAEALARVRDAQLPPSLAAQVFVVRPPTEVPTGRFLGTVHFQRLLREPPSRPVGDCIDGDTPVVRPELGEADVAALLAAYNLLAVAVCDEAERLLGTVTVDDVLDRVLPEDWRERVR